MSEKLEIKTTVDVTPLLLAQLFWEMDAIRQAEFFSALHDITDKESTYGLGEMQWCYMGKEINKDPKAKAQACSMMAWLFNHTTNFLSERLP